ncbi:MAG: type VII toxin-antitoxin system HepT family RNase toxin [Moorellaceae bacterium]
MAYGELNIARLSQKVADIKEALAVLRDYAARNDEDFLNNAEAVRSAKYAFIILIEAATNIANHLCARLLNLVPTSYAESFLLLGENKLIDDALAKRLGKMTGFRNLLVHGYGKIDNKKMLKTMREDLGDLDAFLASLQNIIQRENKPDELK